MEHLSCDMTEETLTLETEPGFVLFKHILQWLLSWIFKVRIWGWKLWNSSISGGLY